MKELNLIIENLKAILEECTASEDAVSYVNGEDAGTLKAVIEALEKQEAIKSCTPPADDWESYADRLHDIAYKNGYEQGKRDAEQDRWIPCSEALPDVRQRVLAQYEDGSMSVVRCIDAGHLTWFYGKTVAWKPAPAPYKGEDEA